METMQKVEPTIIEKEYNAPIKLVFDAWTKVEHLANWQFPMKGFKCAFKETDISPGGRTLHKMTAPNGFEMWLLTKYEEIIPNHTIVFRQYNSDENGEILPNPQMPNWPKELQTTIKLEESDNKTKLQLIWQPITPSEEEATAFDMSRSEHGNGWAGGLANLEQYLEQQ
ncbi:MAG: SRPBCC domain-containing protein [Kangiellaceae bacterium]|nr:SRPBCC domain-containing protein [Kangiellaceae bacterium]